MESLGRKRRKHEVIFVVLAACSREATNDNSEALNGLEGEGYIIGWETTNRVLVFLAFADSAKVTDEG